MKIVIFLLAIFMAMPCYAYSTEAHGNDTAWQIVEHTIRGKNELCPTTAKAYVAKTFHTKDNIGFDTRCEVSYKGWVRNITQENELTYAVGFEF